MGSSAPSRPSNAAPMVDLPPACEVLPRISAVLRGATRELDTVRQKASTDPNTWRRILLYERAPKRLPRVLTSPEVIAIDRKNQSCSVSSQSGTAVQERLPLTGEEESYRSVFDLHEGPVSARMLTECEKLGYPSETSVRRVLHRLCIKGWIERAGTLGFHLIARGEK